MKHGFEKTVAVLEHLDHLVYPKCLGCHVVLPIDRVHYNHSVVDERTVPQANAKESMSLPE